MTLHKRGNRDRDAGVGGKGSIKWEGADQEEVVGKGA